MMAAIQTEGADRVTTLVDHDRELLAATARRHRDALPVRASTALSAAVDELIDPLTLPALVDIDAAETDDATAVTAAVQERMRAAGQDAPTVGAAMARARAARELRTALARTRPRSPRLDRELRRGHGPAGPRRRGTRRRRAGTGRLRHFLFTWLKTQGIDDALIQPYSGHASRQSLEIYNRVALADAQQAYDQTIGRFPV
jgi:hypothetical protein